MCYTNKADFEESERTIQAERVYESSSTKSRKRSFIYGYQTSFRQQNFQL